MVSVNKINASQYLTFLILLFFVGDFSSKYLFVLNGNSSLSLVIRIIGLGSFILFFKPK